jgi:propionate CoA-transferase
LEKGRLRIVKPGPCKFVDKVSHITFCAREALRKGKKVYYVTHVGVFVLTEGGLELREVTPGIDVERDILKASKAKINVRIAIKAM